MAEQPTAHHARAASAASRLQLEVALEAAHSQRDGAGGAARGCVLPCTGQRDSSNDSAMLCGCNWLSARTAGQARAQLCTRPRAQPPGPMTWEGSPCTRGANGRACGAEGCLGRLFWLPLLDPVQPVAACRVQQSGQGGESTARHRGQRPCLQSKPALVAPDPSSRSSGHLLGTLSSLLRCFTADWALRRQLTPAPGPTRCRDPPEASRVQFPLAAPQTRLRATILMGRPGPPSCSGAPARPAVLSRPSAPADGGRMVTVSAYTSRPRER